MIRLYPDPFRKFDPLTGQMPRYFESEFLQIAERARDILKEWSSTRICNTYNEINRLIAHRLERIWEQSLDSTANSRIISPGSPVADLLACLYSEEYLDANENNVTRSEYFGVFALALTAQAYLATSGDYDSAGIQIQLERLRMAGEIAILATEAIVIAAFFADRISLIRGATEINIRGELLDEETIRSMKDRSREYGRRRHESTNALRAFVEQRYEVLRIECPGISNAKAAQRIWDDLPESEQNKLTSDELKTLQEWIGAYPRRMGY